MRRNSSALLKGGAELTTPPAFLQHNRKDHPKKQPKLRKANLSQANLHRADFSGANHNSQALNLTRATLTQCSIYGISVWNVELEGATQNNLVITPYDEPTITIDNLKIAQFIYLLLNNAEIRDVIDTIARKAILIAPAEQKAQELEK